YSVARALEFLRYLLFRHAGISLSHFLRRSQCDDPKVHQETGESFAIRLYALACRMIGLNKLSHDLNDVQLLLRTRRSGGKCNSEKEEEGSDKMGHGGPS
ncbi:MAG: hypothetical protein WBD29_04980, partial [Candidatus Competibacter sp.]